MSDQLAGQVDYIFTDPPYGGHISYLDLSALWNNWLGLTPGAELREKEVIVGGELRHTEEEYIARLGNSVRAPHVERRTLAVDSFSALERGLF